MIRWSEDLIGLKLSIFEFCEKISNLESSKSEYQKNFTSSYIDICCELYEKCCVQYRETDTLNCTEIEYIFIAGTKLEELFLYEESFFLFSLSFQAISNFSDIKEYLKGEIIPPKISKHHQNVFTTIFERFMARATSDNICFPHYDFNPVFQLAKFIGDLDLMSFTHMCSTMSKNKSGEMTPISELAYHIEGIHLDELGDYYQVYPSIQKRSLFMHTNSTYLKNKVDLEKIANFNKQVDLTTAINEYIILLSVIEHNADSYPVKYSFKLDYFLQIWFSRLIDRISTSKNVDIEEKEKGALVWFSYMINLGVRDKMAMKKDHLSIMFNNSRRHSINRYAVKLMPLYGDTHATFGIIDYDIEIYYTSALLFEENIKEKIAASSINYTELILSSQDNKFITSPYYDSLEYDAWINNRTPFFYKEYRKIKTPLDSCIRTILLFIDKTKHCKKSDKDYKLMLELLHQVYTTFFSKFVDDLWESVAQSSNALKFVLFPAIDVVSSGVFRSFPYSALVVDYEGEFMISNYIIYNHRTRLLASMQHIQLKKISCLLMNDSIIPYISSSNIEVDYQIVQNKTSFVKELSKMNDNEILLLYFHGIDIPSSQMFKGIVINDEYVLLEDISSFSFKDKEIILVSCSSGSGYCFHNDFSSSLADAFLDGGAENVLCTLWDIEDVFAKVFMNKYLVIRKIYDSAEFALANTQMFFYQTKTDEVYKSYPELSKIAFYHPHYWSAFTVKRN